MSFTKKPKSPLKTAKDIKEARRIMSMEKGGTEEMIRTQFKQLVHANHPDGQQSPEYGGQLTMERLVWAKKIMLAEIKNV